MRCALVISCYAGCVGKRDFDAVKNAVEMLWGNGHAEGKFNRLKTLKRATYVRAGPELLQARMLPFRYTD